MRRVGEFCRVLHELPIPTIAKVRGGAIGFGANLALCADLVLAAEDAVFGEVFATAGVAMDGAGSWLLPRLIGPQKAKELAFFGAKVTGAQAHELGLINRAVPDADLDKLVRTGLSAGRRAAPGAVADQGRAQSGLRSARSPPRWRPRRWARRSASAVGGPRRASRPFLQKARADFRAADQN